jgi:hypothetical protein
MQVLIRSSALRRDPDKCDVVLKLQDVSKLHASIEKDAESNQVPPAALTAHPTGTLCATTHLELPVLRPSDVDPQPDKDKSAGHAGQ